MDIASIVEATRTRLVRFQGRYPEVVETAAAAGGVKLSYSWLTKFAQGRVPNPTIDNLVALDTALAKLEQPAAPSEGPPQPPCRTPAAKGETAETVEVATAVTGNSTTTTH